MIIKYFEDGNWWITSTNKLDYYKGAVKITGDDPLVTTVSLLELWESELENANYHSMMDMPASLVAVLRKHDIADDKIKALLWDIVSAGAWIP